MTKHAKGMSRRDFLKRTLDIVTLTSLSSCLTGCELYAHKGHSVYVSNFSTYSEEEYDDLKDTVARMVATIYSRGSFFSYGDKVSIKVNLVSSEDCLGMPAYYTYVTNPVVVKALGEALMELGAGSLSIVEGATYPSDTMEVFSELGYNEVASHLGADLIDLNKPDPYAEFHEAEIEDGLVNTSIKANQHLFETDCLVSAAKLKIHSSTGVSLSLKNLIGLLPIQEYGLNGTGPRMCVHAPDPKTQIPNNVVDLARLFPVGFAFIDGIMGIDKGEGPWVSGVSHVTPGVLIAGDNPVATDSIGVSVMGFDSATDYPDAPFINCYNHIKLAADHALGSISHDSIEILGKTPGDVTCPYTPPDKM